MNYLVLGLVILAGFISLKEVEKLHKEQDDIRRRINQLAEYTGAKELSYLYLSEDFLKELRAIYKEDEKKALVKLQIQTKLSLEETKEYLLKLMEEAS